MTGVPLLHPCVFPKQLHRYCLWGKAQNLFPRAVSGKFSAPLYLTSQSLPCHLQSLLGVMDNRPPDLLSDLTQCPLMNGECDPFVFRLCVVYAEDEIHVTQRRQTTLGELTHTGVTVNMANGALYVLIVGHELLSLRVGGG